uniref:Uncharacterized protein n=1 Tax=Avena sativa TaxID=4498 RepID=A0ACD5W776_AVESA
MAPSTECVVTTTRCARHTITHSFLADLPDMITYHPRDGRDRACSLAGGQGIKAGGGRARTDGGHDVRVRHIHGGPSRPAARHEGSAAGGHTRTDAGHRVANVPPRRDDKPAADGRAGRSAGIAVPWSSAAGRAYGSRGKPSTIGQMMAGCSVIYYDEEELLAQRLLRWSATALAIFVAGICGRRDPDVCRRDDGPINVRFGGRPNPHVSRAPYFPTP